MDKKGTKTYQALLFDVDGTLLDFDASEEEGLRRVLLPYAPPDGLDEMIGVYRRVNHGLWDSYEQGKITKDQITKTRFGRVFEEYGIDADGIAAEDRYRGYLNSSAILVDGVHEVLGYLRDRYELYVVTNGFTETQTRRMADSGLNRYFKKSFISEEVGYQKPQKEFFDACFSWMDGVDKGKTLIIGDSLNSDIKGGEAAGIDTCWYNPNGRKNDRGVRVDAEIKDLRELVGWL